MTENPDLPTKAAIPNPRGDDIAARRQRIASLVETLANLPDPTTAAAAVCAILAAEFADAGICLLARPLHATRPTDLVLADYPHGIGLSESVDGDTMSAAVNLAGTSVVQSATATLFAWRSRGDRQFLPEERNLLAAIAPRFAGLVANLIEANAGHRPGTLDPETGLWPLPGFLAQTERRFDRLDIEQEVGTMFAIGWVRSDGTLAPEASVVIVRESAAMLQSILRPSDLIGRVGPTRLGAWCDGVDHLIAAERGHRIVAQLDALLTGSGRHAAIGIAARWPGSGDRPATLLSNARFALEQARITAAARSRPAVRIWQSDDA